MFFLNLVSEVKIAGKPTSTCRYTSDAALPIPYDAERLVWARRNILCATEMRPWMILEAFAERIVRLGAHRSSWRNGISEGSHKSFCSQPVVRAAACSISSKRKLASRREKNLDWCCLSCSDSAIPAVGQNPGFVCCYCIAFRSLPPSMPHKKEAALRKVLPLNIHKNL